MVVMLVDMVVISVVLMDVILVPEENIDSVRILPDYLSTA